MRVVQTELSETEHALLEAYVKRRGTPIKEEARVAIRRMTLPDQVDPKEPIVHAFPLTRKKARITDGSENLDWYLLGRDKCSSWTRGPGSPSRSRTTGTAPWPVRHRSAGPLDG